MEFTPEYISGVEWSEGSEAQRLAKETRAAEVENGTDFKENVMKTKKKIKFFLKIGIGSLVMCVLGER